MIFAQMLEIVALTELASLLCARKFSFIGLSALAVEAYGFTLVRSSVRSSVRARCDIWRSAHQIFLKLGTKLHLGEIKKKKCSNRIFEKKILFAP